MSQLDLANATDLCRWADRLEARARLPELIRRLLTATGDGLTKLTIRAGEGVQLSGWDGIARATGADVHTVQGLSVWEMGTDKQITSKANSDYAKRKADPNGVEPSTATYVFVSPRRWPAKEGWLKARNAEGVWKEVRAYDADDLEHWLSRAPGVHAWLSVLLGKDPYQVESLETWWNAWSQATAPPIPPTLLLPGRANHVNELEKFVQQAPSSRTISADSQEEAVAFVAAVLQNMSNSGGTIERTVIVRTSSAWRRLAVSEHRLLLLALFDGADVSFALKGGHHVIVPVGREVSTEARLQLPRLHRDGIEAALKGIVSDAKLSQLATLGRRSLLSLRRAMAISPVVHTPEWSRPEHARDIIPVILAGRWVDGCKGDQESLAKLAARSYEEVAALLVRWANSSDPPIRRVGDVWLVAAKQDAWTLIARYFTPDDLHRFQEVVTSVISSEESASGAPSGSPFLMVGPAQSRTYSSHLVAGLADTLALMGAVSDEVPLVGERRSGEVAASTVRKLLEKANRPDNKRGWLEISGVLPALAEAAPEVFLEGVEIGLKGTQPLANVFQDSCETGCDIFFGGSSAHCNLLWALELLAWNRDYIASATLALSKLAAIDPGGRLGNRPASSLYNIHVLWSRGTAASFNERLHALDVVRRSVSVVAWHLCLRLLPISGTCSPPQTPTWRDWRPEGDEGVLRADLRQNIDALCERILEDVGANEMRWAEVLQLYTDFPPPFRTRIIEELRRLSTTLSSDETRRVITDAIRNLTVHHRAYPQAKWSLSSHDLDLLESIIEELQPLSVLHRHRWLFTPGASMAFGSRTNRQQRDDDLEDSQIQAIKEIYTAYGLETLISWVEHLNNSSGTHWLGNGLGSINLLSVDTETLLDLIAAGDGRHYQIAFAFVRKRASLAGEDWIEWVKGVLSDHLGWSSNHIAGFLAAFPSGPEVWDMAENKGMDTDRAYWSRLNHYGSPERADEYVRAARNLIKYGRAHSAVDLLHLYKNEIGEELPTTLVADALEVAASTEPFTPLEPMFKLHVGRHLDWLAKNSFDEKRMAALEWLYLPMFRYDTRRFPILHAALAENPVEFVSVISMIYRADGEDPVDLSETDQSKAKTAFDLLESWRDVPGTLEDRTIDQTQLFSWVAEVRRLLTESGRLNNGDHRIGRILRYGPPPRENQWPCEPIRNLIEDLVSANIEEGLYIEVCNSRGVTGRGMAEGGAQERILGDQYRQYAYQAASRWPRTAALLRRISNSYSRDARRYDLQADLNQDLWM